MLLMGKDDEEDGSRKGISFLFMAVAGVLWAKLPSRAGTDRVTSQFFCRH